MLTETQYSAISFAMAELNDEGFDVLTMTIRYACSGTLVRISPETFAVSISREDEGMVQSECFESRADFTRTYDARYPGVKA